MNNFKYLLWDVDGTLLDFMAAEKAAIKSLFNKYHMGECTDEMIGVYSSINLDYWHRLERNEITKQELLVKRFDDFFNLYGLDTSITASFNKDYQYALGDTIIFCDNSYELLNELKESYIQAIVTNGTRTAQDKKLSKSGFDKIIDFIFISEIIGIEKPNKAFFDRVIEEMNVKDPKQVLLIGDSLSSDILGGNNAGFKTCWYNPTHNIKSLDVTADYEISNLNDIKNILSK